MIKRMKIENKIAMWLILLAFPAGIVFGIIDHVYRSYQLDQALNRLQE